jgi:hypothetical protein
MAKAGKIPCDHLAQLTRVEFSIAASPVRTRAPGTHHAANGAATSLPNTHDVQPIWLHSATKIFASLGGSDAIQLKPVAENRRYPLFLAPRRNFIRKPKSKLHKGTEFTLVSIRKRHYAW